MRLINTNKKKKNSKKKKYLNHSPFDINKPKIQKTEKKCSHICRKKSEFPTTLE